METKRFTNFSTEGGIYLLGDTAFNPHTKEEFYYIKVGQSKHIKRRIRDYVTHSPSVWHIDQMVTEDRKIYEDNYQGVLVFCELETTTTEWHRVSREVYLQICEMGFKWFEKKVKCLKNIG